VALGKHSGYNILATPSGCHHLDVLELVEIIEHHLVFVLGL
jgi:hypothetical protein